MQANVHSSYALKDLHQAIDLIDRKIVYCREWERFASPDGRETQLRKLSSKRASLVKSALTLTNLGVSCDPQFLPRSFINLAPAEAQPATASTDVVEGTKGKKPSRPRQKRS